MLSEILKNDLSVILGGVHFQFRAGTELNYYSSGNVKSGTLAVDVTARVGLVIRKIPAGMFVEFEENGTIRDTFFIVDEKIGNVMVIRVTGSLEANHALELEEHINRHITGGSVSLVLELSQVTYLSSSGIRVLIATLREMKRVGGILVLASLSDDVSRIMRVADLNGLFIISSTVEDALQHFGSSR